MHLSRRPRTRVGPKRDPRGRPTHRGSKLAPRQTAPHTLTLTCVEDESLRQRAAALRGRVEAGLDRDVCVVGQPVRRTLKLLNALARGTWVVGEEYLEVTARSRGAALDPSPYELTQHIPGCRVAREAGGGRAVSAASHAELTRRLSTQWWSVARVVAAPKPHAQRAEASASQPCSGRSCTWRAPSYQTERRPPPATATRTRVQERVRSPAPSGTDAITSPAHATSSSRAACVRSETRSPRHGW